MVFPYVHIITNLPRVYTNEPNQFLKFNGTLFYGYNRLPKLIQLILYFTAIASLTVIGKQHMDLPVYK